jgi:cytochrome c oxidase subunit III
VNGRVYLDVSELPAHSFGSRDLLWWGTIGFMVIEGSMFAMLLVTWGYLRGIQPEWPPPGFAPPDLLLGTLNTGIMLASAWPNLRLRPAAERLDLRATLRLMWVMDAFATAFLVVRVLELIHLNVRWDANAYGSIVWLLLGFHTFHIATDFFETLVIGVMTVTGPMKETRFVDVEEDGMYWYFVVASWLPTYAVIYLAPRFF